MGAQQMEITRHSYFLSFKQRRSWNLKIDLNYERQVLSEVSMLPRAQNYTCKRSYISWDILGKSVSWAHFLVIKKYSWETDEELYFEKLQFLVMRVLNVTYENTNAYNSNYLTLVLRSNI